MTDDAPPADATAHREGEALDRLLELGSSVRPDATHAYGDLPDQCFEVYEPGGAAGPGPARTLVVVHGGYFRPSVDRTHARPMARALAAAGWQVVLAEYRRVPGDPGASTSDLAALDHHLSATTPEATNHAAAAWVGHSAGGALVMWRALQPDLPATTVLALAPVADLDAAVRDRLGSDAVRDWIGTTPPGATPPGATPPDATHLTAADLYADLDPLRLRAARPTASSRVHVLHGDADVTVPLRQSEAWERRVLRGAHHFDVVDPGSPHWPAVLDEVSRCAAPRRP